MADREAVLNRLSRFFKRPQEIPTEGAFTGFLGTDELAEWLPRFAERRMLAGVFGGYRMPRRVMLRVVPPGDASIVASRLRDELRDLLTSWEKQAPAFPATWLRLDLTVGGDVAARAREAGSWIRLLAAERVAPEWLGDFLSGEVGTFLLIDAREEPRICEGLQSLGVGVLETRRQVPWEDFARSATVHLRSLRLDALVGKAFGLGREEAKKATVRGFVAVNLLQAGSASASLSSGDLVDFELEGRALVQEAEFQEKRGRFRVALAVVEEARMWKMIWRGVN